AIRVAKTEEEYNKIKKENDDDPRETSDLFIDRYGAEPIEPTYQISLDQFSTQILESGELIIAELFNDSSIMCLIKTIPIKDLIKDIKYKKIDIEEDTQLLKRYEIANLPALLFFKNGKLLGKIEDRYTPEKKEELKEKINKIISKNN
ncbi:MAG: thioredoxin family protein, partial [archaeon]|nr:thioredoxin family protein [archaeon]